MQDDLQGYADILDAAKQPAGDIVNRKWSETLSHCNDMQMQISERKNLLNLQLNWLEFERDSTELLKWLSDKRAQAQSDDYGQDLEHLILIREKFAKLRDEITLTCESRYARLKKLGSDLLAAKSPEAKNIRKRLDDLKATRDHLDQDLLRREAVLNSAAELHQFNRDVNDLLRRIGDKELAFESVATDLGRDARTCNALQRKHVIFVDELNTIRIQLFELNKNSEILREKHPGDTAESVASEMSELIERFSKIWSLSEARSAELVQSNDLFKFMTLVRDANAWISETRHSILGDVDPSRFIDLFAVAQIRQQHNTLSFEMTQRDDVFKLVEEMCLELTTTQMHPSKKEIIGHTNRIMSERENLFRLWKLKSKLLDVEHECHEFYRDVLKAISSISSQDNLLNKALNDFQLQLDSGVTVQNKNGSQEIVPFTEYFTVEDLESLQKAHDNLTRKIEKQSLAKLNELQKRGSTSIEAETARVNMEDQRELFPDVNELPRLNTTLSEVKQRDNALQVLCTSRGKQLKEAVRFLQLKRDIDEFLAWIDVKIQAARQMRPLENASLVLSDKVKLFQRQKALTSDIETNMARHGDLIKRTQDQIVHNRTVRAQYAKYLLDELNREWQNLACEAKERAKEFAEAKDLLEFNDELEQLDAWLQEKELMLNNGDVGTDYEHCVALIKKADETIAPQYEEKLQFILALGDKLVKMGQTDHELVLEKKNRLLNQFKQIREGVEQYKAKLNGALEVHAFTRDYDDLQERIKAKTYLLTLDTDLRTLDAVQAAQSKLIDLERDLKAIEQKVNQLSAESRRLNVSEKMSSIQTEWAALGELLSQRKAKLDFAYAYNKFIVEYSELSAWLVDMHTRVHTQPEPSTLSEAETAFNLHQERRTELEGKLNRFVAIRDMARRLVERNASSECEIGNYIKEMNDMHQQLQQTCNDKQKFFQECMDFQDLRETWKQLADTWLKNVEQVLRSTDLGDSVIAVRSLLTKHENVESSIKSQTQPGAAFDALEQRANDMIKQKYTQSVTIAKLIVELQLKRKELHSLSSQRRKQLEDALMFQQFMLNYYEAVQWIKEKTATALDKTYLDLTNLQTKMQRHVAFMIDLKKSGVKRVEDVHKEADALLVRHQSTAYSLGPSSAQIVNEIQE